MWWTYKLEFTVNDRSSASYNLKLCARSPTSVSKYIFVVASLFFTSRLWSFLLYWPAPLPLFFFIIIRCLRFAISSNFALILRARLLYLSAIYVYGTEHVFVYQEKWKKVGATSSSCRHNQRNQMLNEHSGSIEESVSNKERRCADTFCTFANEAFRKP